MYEVPSYIVPAPQSTCSMPRVTDPGLGQAQIQEHPIGGLASDLP